MAGMSISLTGAVIEIVYGVGLIPVNLLKESNPVGWGGGIIY